ncbi:MFS transporter [Streptosporangium subroseum]|uniref:MFS transporter n=1 Tax=Streptosporangium subroseum TaxID=106412 RepID=UPI0034490C09
MAAGLSFRLARAAAFAVVCLTLGVIAHVFGGGTVSAPPAAGGLLVIFLAALSATGRERGFRAILPMLAGVQALLHLYLMLAPSGGAALAEAAGHVHSGLVPGLGMIVVHGGATGLTALWLARGEAALWAVLHRLAGRLRHLLVIQPDARATPGDQRRPREHVRAVLRAALLRYALSRRGPPQAAPHTG